MPIVRKKSNPKWPPVVIREGETDVEKRARLQEEAEAKRVSDQIDQQIEQDRQRRTKFKGAKVLLLGQAESGKSTVLKNFQLHLAPKAFERELEAWRPVIHLNLVRSVNFIVNLVLSRGRRDSVSEGQHRLSSALSPEIRKLCIGLAPLRQVEESLIKSLWGDSAPRPNGLNREGKGSSFSPTSITLPNGYSWKRALGLQKSSQESLSSTSTRSGGRSQDGQNRRILAALGDDIVALWNNSGVQKILTAADINLKEHPGFFLDQAARITQEDYRPTPNDVVRARVTTQGPEEHVIVPEINTDRSKNWTIYDVGGSRAQRAAWAQYFDDVNMIIFMAPMSAFNQVLAEDETVNRLTDSLRLWQMLCSNKILAGVDFILFLNKMDILDAKLKAGIQFSSFVTSYVNKPNETKPVARYLLDVFVSIHQQNTPGRRKLHPHLTCAVDTEATSLVIARIHDVILVKILQETNII
ncbi:hypothetical protein D9613_008643 [Agrocybe pediades]|uniref:G-alpha-domain-containing protein n=1 Tax=Agrocybe pediades TaxID=84607 RepID=A0A8H4QUV0_9AGAR|nr:hypothetical protein D9613_008643 [Agrocybe pediades]